MRAQRKFWRTAAWSVPVGALALGAVLLIRAYKEHAEYRATLDALIRQGANQDEVVTRLGPALEVQDRGSWKWEQLSNFLQREPSSSSFWVPLKKAVERYPRFLYYTTDEPMMTWIFLDDRGIMRDYFISVQ